MRDPRPCDKCGAMFRPYRPQRGAYAYCSPECVIWGSALVQLGLAPDFNEWDIRLYKKCCRCGDLFPRDTPNLRGECRICSRLKERVRASKRDRPPTKCDGCGKEYRPSRGGAALRRWKGTRKTFCSRECNRVYVDARERMRQAKRRQRASYWERGLTGTGTEPKGSWQFECSKALRAYPEGGTFHKREERE